MLSLLTIFTACLQDLDISSLHETNSNEIINHDPDHYQQPLIIEWKTIEDIWFGTGDELPSKEENVQAYDILLTVYIEEFRPRIEIYQSKDATLTLEVEFLFGVVLRSMNKRHRLSQKSRKKQLEKLQIKIQTLIE
jgi:hypothetical protein